MDYCTRADIEAELTEAELIQLTDDMVPPVRVNSAVVTKAIADAGALIDGFLGRYQLPLTVVPVLVRNLAVDIAVYRLFVRRKKRGVPEAVKDAYADAMKRLEKIQTGAVSIGVTQAGDSAPAATDSGAQVIAAASVFGPETLEDF